MKTGFSLQDETVEANETQALFDILTPVLEKTVVIAARYARACERDCVVSKDFEYAAKYCARHCVGEDIGSMFPGDWSDDDDDDDLPEVVDDEPTFTRYAGSDAFFLAVNRAVDTWDDWTPSSPVEEMLKKAVDNN